MSKINDYFMGKGKVLAALLDSAGKPGGLVWLGDAEKFEIDPNQKFDDVFESYTGRNTKAAHILTQTELKIALTLNSWSVENLTMITQGSTSGAESAGTVTAEAVKAAPGKSAMLEHFNVSAVVVKKGSTTLVSGTDYTLDAANGMLTFLSSSTEITAPSTDLLVDYAFGAYSGKVEGLMTGPRGYQLVFMGQNLGDDSKGLVRVVVHRSVLDLPKNLAFIDSKHSVLDVSGEVLIDTNQPDDASQFFSIMKQN